MQFAALPGAGISIHALREEGDMILPMTESRLWLFLSTPSARRATSYVGSEWGLRNISIHALREEGDKSIQLPIG